MKLVNLISQKGYPMERVGPFQGLAGELVLKGRRSVLEWTVSIMARQAVLAGVPEVRILEACPEDRLLLEEAKLSLLLDGEPAVDRRPLLGEHGPIPPAHDKRHWMMAIDQDLPRGVFMTNGTVVEAVVTLPQAPHGAPRIGVRLAGDVYQDDVE